MNSDVVKKPGGLVIITVGLMVGDVMMRNIMAKNGKLRNASPSDSDWNVIEKKMLAIALLFVVLAITADQVPEFARPFMLLIIVVLLYRDAPLISDYFNQTQGKSK